MPSNNGAYDYETARANAALKADMTGQPVVVCRNRGPFEVTSLEIFAAVYNGPGQTAKTLYWVEWPVWRR